MGKNYYTGVRVLEDKLAEMLAEKSLLHVMDKSKYPITLTVTQNQAPDAQMALYDTTDGSMSSQDSVLQFIFELDGLEIHTNNRLVIDEKFMNKIKGQAKKIHAAYVHAFFATNISAFRSNTDEDLSEDEDMDEDLDEDAEDINRRFDDFYSDPDEDPDAEEAPDSEEDLDTEEMAEDDFGHK